MSIKKIQHSLNSVNNISAKVNNLEKSMYLKNLLNILYHENDVPVGHIFFEKSYLMYAEKMTF